MTSSNDISILNASLALTEPNANDIAPELLKAALGLVPVFGNVAGFVIDQRPAKQTDRIRDFLLIITRLVADMAIDVEALKERAAGEEGGELFHSGLVAAASSTTYAKRARLAAIVVEGLTADEVHASNEARRLKIMATLDDFEFSLLLAMERDGRIDYPYPAEYQRPAGVGEQNAFLTEGSGNARVAPIALSNEVAAASLADLLLALNRLVGLGLAESDVGQAMSDERYKSFWLTIAGTALVSECRP